MLLLCFGTKKNEKYVVNNSLIKNKVQKINNLVLWICTVQSTVKQLDDIL